MKWLTVRWIRVALLGLLMGCENDPPGNGKPCPKAAPAFDVLIRGQKHVELPQDTEVRLTHAGSLEETYVLADPKPLEALFCKASDWSGRAERSQRIGQGGAAGAAGAAGAGGSDGFPEALDCELWVEAPATLEVKGGLYTPARQELELELDHCGQPKTVDVVIDLEIPDAGAAP